MILLSNVYNFLINHFENEPLINTISCVKEDEIGANKQTIYPLINIELIEIPTFLESNFVYFSFRISALSDRDFDKKVKQTKLIGGDNKIDNFNEMHYVLQKFINKVSKSNNPDSIDVSSIGSIEPLDGITTTVLDGFSFEITLSIPNTVSIC